ncbi:hypothetical protein V2J09_000308 [Rumex salicifolius]
MLIQTLISMRYKGKRNIRVHNGNVNLVGKQKTLKLEITNDFLVHLVLLPLPTQFTQFKASYNNQKEKWTLNKLILQCVQEEGNIEREKRKSTHFASSSKNTRMNNVASKVDRQVMLKHSSTWSDGNKRNLISTSSLDKSGYFCGFENGRIDISSDSNSTGILVDRLYMLKVIACYHEIMYASSNGIKRKFNEDYASLWHKRLDHISKQRIQRLVSDKILDSLD